MNPDVKKEYIIYREKIWGFSPETPRENPILDFAMHLSSFLPSQKYSSLLLNTYHTQEELEKISNELYDILIIKDLYQKQ